MYPLNCTGTQPMYLLIRLDKHELLRLTATLEEYSEWAVEAGFNMAVAKRNPDPFLTDDILDAIESDIESLSSKRYEVNPHLSVSLSNRLSNAINKISEYINKYVLYTFPAQYDLGWFFKGYNFDTGILVVEKPTEANNPLSVNSSYYPR